MKIDNKIIVKLILFIIFAAVLLYGISNRNKYKKVKEQYDILLIEKVSKVDSLVAENKKLQNILNDYQLTINDLDFKIDSLKNHKEYIIKEIQPFKISNSISETADLLKQNLKCEN